MFDSWCEAACGFLPPDLEMDGIMSLTDSSETLLTQNNLSEPKRTFSAVITPLLDHTRGQQGGKATNASCGTHEGGVTNNGSVPDTRERSIRNVRASHPGSSERHGLTSYHFYSILAHGRSGINDAGETKRKGMQPTVHLGGRGGQSIAKRVQERIHPAKLE